MLVRGPNGLVFDVDGPVATGLLAAGLVTVVDETPATPSSEGVGQFDPSDFSVEEVLAYLDSAEPDEFNRVIAAEKAGKQRKTIIGM